MDQKFLVLLALGLLVCLSLPPVCGAQDGLQDVMEEGLEEEMDVEDELDLGLAAGEEEEEMMEGDAQEEAPAEPKTPPIPKVTYKAPEPMGEHFIAESFDRGTLDGWVMSSAKKEEADEDIAKYDGKWVVEEMKDSKLAGDKGLVLKTRAKHHAISAQLLRPFVFDSKPLIIQYEVNFQSGLDCGGAYVKLLTQTPDLDLDQFTDKTPYTIMFGPDKLLNPDNTFEVLVDQTVVNSGSLLSDMTPAVNPAAEIEDPDDQKPEDWDERPKIQDPAAAKPEDWDEDAPAQIADEDAVKPDGWLDDEPEYIGDPEAVKPEDWDEDMDGEWEAPQVPNPLCETAPGCGEWKRPMIDNPNHKGKWKSPMIDNPNYQGVWKPRKVANPVFFEDLQPFRMSAFSAVGLELWSMTNDIFFDNFFITDDRSTAERWANDGWGLKKAAEGAADPGLATQMLNAAEERPWLWVVYVLTIALPIILIVVFCFTGKEEFKESGPPTRPSGPVTLLLERRPERRRRPNTRRLTKLTAEGKSDGEESPAEKEEEKEEEEAEKEEEEETAEEKLEDDVLRRSPRNRKVRKD
ncbi:Calnexin [Dissostichus eleginoides]|uniref:Calnexin n=2 Tax=Dissostichus eleginoides TaxID=100907 RepID=A0AAD9CM77_DISEL|nr:Calnexin [Dissostichus eleginoides]